MIEDLELLNSKDSKRVSVLMRMSNRYYDNGHQLEDRKDLKPADCACCNEALWNQLSLQCTSMKIAYNYF